MSLLTVDEKQTLPDIAYGVLPTLEGNAWAFPAPNGDVAICIDMLLPTTLWIVSRAIAEEYRILYEGPSSGDSISDVVRPIWLAARWFVTRKSEYESELWDWKDALGKLPKEISIMFAGIDNAQIDFVVMHELQHIICGHLASCRRQLVSLTDRKGSYSEVEVYQRSIAQEYEADMKATDAFCRRQTGLVVGRFALCEILFLFLHAVELQGARAPNETTHPSALKRLEAIRQRYDEVTGGMQGFGLGFRRVMDNQFALYTEMYNEFPHDLWMHPHGWKEIQSRYIRAVMEEDVRTHVTIGGSLPIEFINEVATLANTWCGHEELVHVGSISPSPSLLPELAMARSLVGGLAALASLLTQLFRLRKAALEKKRWNLEYLEELIANEMLKHDVQYRGHLEILYFDESVDTDGDLCVIKIHNTNIQRDLTLRITTKSATFSIFVTNLTSGIVDHSEK